MYQTTQMYVCTTIDYCVVSDIAVFVLKRGVKLQPTDYCVMGNEKISQKPVRRRSGKN